MTIHLKNKDIFERRGTSRHCLVFSVCSVAQPVWGPSLTREVCLCTCCWIMLNFKQISSTFSLKQQTTYFQFPKSCPCVPPCPVSSLSVSQSGAHQQRSIKKIITLNKNTGFFCYFILEELQWVESGLIMNQLQCHYWPLGVSCAQE